MHQTDLSLLKLHYYPLLSQMTGAAGCLTPFVKDALIMLSDEAKISLLDEEGFITRSSQLYSYNPDHKAHIFPPSIQRTQFK